MNSSMKIMLVFAVVSSVIGAFGVIEMRSLIQGRGDMLSSLSTAGWVASLVLLIASAARWAKSK